MTKRITVSRDYFRVAMFIDAGIYDIHIDVTRRWYYDHITEKNILEPAEINWPSIGPQSPREAQKFGDAILVAVKQAAILNSQKFRRPLLEETQ